MDKVQITDELIISLLKEKKYEDAWGYCKYIGYPIVSSSDLRLELFMSFVQQFDCSNDKFIIHYIDKLKEFKESLRPLPKKYFKEEKTSYKMKKG